MHRMPLIVIAATLLVGCVNIHIDEAGIAALESMAEGMNDRADVARDAEAIDGPVRRFLVVRGTVLEEQAQGRRQILVETSIVYAPGSGPVQALATATPYEHDGPTPVWQGGLQAPDASFGLRAKVVEMPAIVTLNTDEAKVQVGIMEGKGQLLHGVEVTPWIENDELRIHVTYEYRVKQDQDEEGEGDLLRLVPTVTLAGPPARVWILEIQSAADATTATR